MLKKHTVKRIPGNFLLFSAILILPLITSTCYHVQENQLAVVTRFGKVIKVTTTEGYKFMIPGVDTVYHFPKDFITWDSEPETIPTADKLFVTIKISCTYYISDPVKFFTLFESLPNAEKRLSEILSSAARIVISNSIASDLTKKYTVITDKILQEAKSRLTDTGISLNSVGFLF